MKKSKLCRGLAAGALCAAALTIGASAAYRDVPAGHWAAGEIDRATTAGFIAGQGDGVFGLGLTMTRAEFASMLTRLMGWESAAGGAAFSDVAADAWYHDAVQTIAANGAVDAGGAFRPGDAITREEMAVMLVRALGYPELAADNADLSIPFTDVHTNQGYIAMAYDFGIIAGKSDTSFDPSGTAKREEAAAMMVRLFDKYTAPLDWVHGFYAISSWSQRDLAAQMEAVSFGWARLEYTDGAVQVNTTDANGNTWRVPDGYDDAVQYLAGAQENLAVQLTDQAAARAVLLSDENRREAARQMAAACEQLGLAGVTVDFEGMKGAELKAGFTAFLAALREEIGDKPLYVCVHPVLKSGGEYYDAYDYRAIGETADKVILMAHDYAAAKMDANLMAAGFTTTPVTPFEEVYYALRCAADAETGVQDTSKLVLAVSTPSTAAWQLSESERTVLNETALHPSRETVLKRLAQADTVVEYSHKYRNPCATYRDDNGVKTVLWYEDARSVLDKITLARMFGVNGLSIWRVGEIPQAADSRMDIWQAIQSERE